MEVELGLKITRSRDNSTSISDFQFAKDRAGPVFLSRETDSMFILTAHLKGYKRENIDINISEDGAMISVSGEKEVLEMHMIPIPFKKEVKTKGFKKNFRIPDEVDLDKIKAKFNEEEAVLRIVMPKMVKGICRVGIEEVKEEKVVHREVTPEPQPQERVPEKVIEETSPQPPQKKKSPKKPWKPCPPLVLGGSSLLVSIIFLVIHYIRARKS